MQMWSNLGGQKDAQQQQHIHSDWPVETKSYNSEERRGYRMQTHEQHLDAEDGPQPSKRGSKPHSPRKWMLPTAGGVLWVSDKTDILTD